MKSIKIFTLLVAFASSYALKAQTPSYHILRKIQIRKITPATKAFWDYIAVDSVNKKLYVSHGTLVNIVNELSGDSSGAILKTIGIHGIAFDYAHKKGFTSNGRTNTVTVFDLNSYQPLGTVATGTGPDAIFFDDYSKRIYTCNGRSKDMTVIDPVKMKAVGTVALSGKPETAVSDGAGKIFVNIEDKNSISVVDVKTLKVTATYTLNGGEEPSGLSIDRVTHRLFAGCGNKVLIVINADNGQKVASVPTGDGCDGTEFDPSTHLIFSSNGEDATVSVIKETDANTFSLVENVTTIKGARTIVLDRTSHHLFLPTNIFPDKGSATPTSDGFFGVVELGY